MEETLTFDTGTNRECVDIPVVEDDNLEEDEDFDVILETPDEDVILRPPRGNIVIRDRSGTVYVSCNVSTTYNLYQMHNQKCNSKSCSMALKS